MVDTLGPSFYAQKRICFGAPRLGPLIYRTSGIVDSTRVYRATKFTKFPIVNHRRFSFHDACGCQILCTSSAKLWSLGKERLVGNYAVHSFPIVYEDLTYEGTSQTSVTQLYSSTRTHNTHSYTQLYKRQFSSNSQMHIRVTGAHTMAGRYH
jgi:hypothetical protein